MLIHQAFVLLTQTRDCQFLFHVALQGGAKRKVFAWDPIFGGSCVSKSLPLKDSPITKVLLSPSQRSFDCFLSVEHTRKNAGEERKGPLPNSVRESNRPDIDNLTLITSVEGRGGVTRDDYAKDGGPAVV